MPKTHRFDDGTVVELDDDVEVEDFLDADADDIEDQDYEQLVKDCEARVEVGDEPEDLEPAGGAG
ncbi:hypothetical protein [Nesterenkonia populi]|uniref:hypothetical protein n=1 Tax=Nesterenkonia populi TaxID=1591087 RepID=UPI0011BDA64D|nr:hypothetical protein [Nesterenkonia populi]